MNGSPRPGPPAQIAAAVNCIFAARPASFASLRPKRAAAALSVGHLGVNSGIWKCGFLCLVSAWSLLARRARFRAQFYFSGKTVPVRGQAPPGPAGGPGSAGFAARSISHLYMASPLEDPPRPHRTIKAGAGIGAKWHNNLKTHMGHATRRRRESRGCRPYLIREWRVAMGCDSSCHPHPTHPLAACHPPGSIREILHSSPHAPKHIHR